MLKRFDDPENRHRPERALQIYQILIGMAHNRQTTTYGRLSDLVGFKGAGVFAQTLGLIMTWCHGNGLPPLTALVVGRHGTPGSGLATTEDTDRDRERVYDADWYGIFPPSLDELRSIAKERT